MSRDKLEITMTNVPSGLISNFRDMIADLPNKSYLTNYTAEDIEPFKRTILEKIVKAKGYDLDQLFHIRGGEPVELERFRNSLSNMDVSGLYGPTDSNRNLTLAFLVEGDEQTVNNDFCKYKHFEIKADTNCVILNNDSQEIVGFISLNQPITLKTSNAVIRNCNEKPEIYGDKGDYYWNDTLTVGVKENIKEGQIEKE